jgi:RNA polymerase sigma-B factor
MLQAASCTAELARLRASMSLQLQGVRGHFELLRQHSDTALAEVSRPRPRAGRGSSRPPGALDFYDRSTWYLHVRYARRHDAPTLESLVAVYQDDADRRAWRVASPLSREDLVQVAREALVIALHRFEPQRRKPFLPFARLTVDGSLRRYLRDQGYAVRPTRRIYELTPLLRSTTEWLTQEFGRPPSSAELADALNVDVAEVDEAIASSQNRTPISLDRPVGEEGLTLAELSGHPDASLAGVLDRYAVEQLTEGLSEGDRSLLDEYFFQGRTQQQIAEAHGVSQMHVSRSLARVLRRLRARVTAG